MADSPINILLCRCEYFHAVPEQTVSAVRAALDGTNGAVEEVDDLCGLAARHDRRLARIAGAPRSAVVACYPRAVTWLFATAGASLDDGRVELLNMHEQGPDEIAAGVSAAAEAAAEAHTGDFPVDQSDTSPAIEADWKPWFPILDHDRCTNCGQCMSFCLFGVYDVDGEGRIVVRKPNNCKTNCPACARICPEAAIMFPKLDQAPINGAEPTSQTDGVAQVDISEALGPNLYATLRSRTKGTRFASQDARARAEAERYRCATLRAIRERLGITPEVIESIMADCGPDCECHNQPVIDCGPDCECHDPTPSSSPADADRSDNGRQE